MKPELETVKNNIEFSVENQKVICLIGFYNSLSQVKLNNILKEIDEDFFDWNVKITDETQNDYANEIEIALKN